MAKTRQKLSKDEILERREAEHAAKEPRRKRKEREPVAIAEVLPEVMEAAEQRQEKPYFAAVPNHFRQKGDEAEGMRRLESPDGKTAAIQFAENRTPDRSEKDFMEERGLRYEPYPRVWMRRDYEKPMTNRIVVERAFNELADARGQGVGR